MVKKLLFFFIFCSLSTLNAIIEKKFVIIITSYNNAAWCVKNLETIFFQKNADNTDLYQNYRVIIIDDESYDGNAEFMEHSIYAHNQQHRVTLIKNKTRARALANIYRALQLCEPDEIVFTYDGDDWLAHDGVFALINEIYQDPDVWLTYGSFINWPSNQMGYSKPVSDEIVQNQLFRKKWWLPGQLRTAYAWLFHQIQLKDLLFDGPYFQGQFFPANYDIALYYPCMEMAGFHYRYIPDVIYIRNVETPINDFKANKDIQVLGSKLIREKNVYPRLENSRMDYFKQFGNKKADLVVFSENYTFAKQLINSCQKLARNINKIFIFYQKTTDAMEKEYKHITANPYTLELRVINPKTFKEELINTLKRAENYILFAHDGIILNQYVDCSACILSLEKAFAYGLFLSLDPSKNISHQTGMPQPMPPLNCINDDINAWSFQYVPNGDWQCYNNVEFTLYRTKNVLQQIKDLTFNNHHELFQQWKKVPFDLEQIGLCYGQSKVGYITWH